MGNVHRFLTFALCFLLGSTLLLAQTGGSINGRVTDSSGAAVPNVRVELENTTTGQRISATTGPDGTYTFNDVPVGNYRLVTLGTTSPSNAQPVAVELGRTGTINYTMPSGPGTDVMVQAETSAATMNSASIQDNYNTRWVQYLPQPNFLDRDGTIYGAYNLSLLSPALTQSPLGERGPAVAGNRPGSNNYHIDGIDNNNKAVTGPLVYLPNEATTEFGLFHNTPSPRFGQSAGGQFNSMVRTGSNQLHGSVYNYLQNRHLNAMDPRFRALGYDENPRYDQNRLGASIGLPVIPSKFFFFGNFEYIPLGFRAPLSSNAYAPTAAGIAQLARIPGVSATNLGILQNSVGTVGEASRFTVVNGQIIPLGLVNSEVRGWQNQFIGAGSGDWTITDKDQLRVRYIHNEGEANNSGFGLPAFATPRRNKSLFASAAHYHIFGDAVTNELRFGFNRFAQFFDPANYRFGGLNVFPNVSVTGLGLALGPQFGLVDNAALNTYHLADSVAVRIGGHNLRFGFDGRRFLGYQGGFASGRGNYTYSNLGRFLLDLPPDVVAQRTFGTDRFDMNQWLLFGFVQDRWNVTPQLTVDLGLGYQYATIPTGFEFQQRNALASTTGVLDFNRIENQKSNFAPHVGIAFSPGWSRMTVLRAGFGMHYDAMTTAQTMIGFVPGLFRNVYGNITSNRAGFLSGGGITDPLAGVREISPAQARALTSAWMGPSQMPYSMQWNAAIEQAIWSKSTLEFKYLGNRGVHLPFMERLNSVSGVTAQRNLPLFLNRPAQAELNALPVTLNQLAVAPAGDPFAAAGFTSPITGINWGGNSWYHAGIASLRHEFTGGFQLKANYTWSQWTEDVTGTAMDLVSLGRQRARSIYDTRHTANITGMFEVAPLFRNTYSVVRNIFADFNINGTYTFQTGQAMPVLSGTDVALNGSALGAGAFFNASGTSGVGTGVSPLTNSQGQVVAYLANNPNAQWIAGGPGQFPTNGRRGLALPDLHNLDVSAVKRFNWSDRFSFELRGDAYNVLNRRNFSLGPVNNLGSRFMATVPGLLNPGNPDFGNLTSALSGNPRTLQLALRVAF